MRHFFKDSTSNFMDVFIQDDTGQPLTGLVYNTSGLTAYYHNGTGSSSSSVSLVNMTLGTFTSGGFKEIDATNMPGFYQFCPPNAMVDALGGGSLLLQGVAGMLPCAVPFYVEKNPWDELRADHPTSNTFGQGVASVQGNVTGSVASVSGNIGGNVAGTVASVTGNVGGNVVGSVASVSGNVGGSVASVTGNIGGNVVGSVGSVSGNVGGNVVGSVASVTNMVTANMTQISGDSTAADNLEAALDGTGGVTITAGLTGNITGNLSGSVGSVTGNVGGNVVGSVASVTGNVGGNVVGSVASVTAAVTVGTNNDKTGYALSTSGIDAIMTRDISNSESATTPSLNWAVAALCNKSDIGTPGSTSATLTIYKADNSTTLFAKSLTLASGINPIVAQTKGS